MNPPDYFNRVVAEAEGLWGKLKDPVLAWISTDRNSPNIGGKSG